METVLRIIAGLSFLAFVVGMIKPAAVKCATRGRVALVYLGIFIVCVGVGASLSDDGGNLHSSQDGAQGTESSAEAQSQEAPKEIPTLTDGAVYTLPYANSNVEIKFAKIKLKKIPNGGLNLILSLVIKNNSNETFFISNCDWRLLDADKIEVEEAGIYDPMFGDFMPGTFFFTTVDPNIGKKENVGYSVKEETYYLSINGKVIAQIPLDKKE